MSRMVLCSSDVSYRFLTYTLTCVRGCPAYAGMDLVKRRKGSGVARLPRLRGDGPLLFFPATFRGKAAPPTRGWTQVGVDADQSRRGCPAYAGMDRPAASYPRTRQWLPRLRGDGPVPPAVPVSLIEAAPPTRGWTFVIAIDICSADGCPAYAGMDPTRAGMSL